MQPVVRGLALAVAVLVKGQRKRRLVTQDNRFRLREIPQQAATRLVQEYGLAERAAEFVYGRLQGDPEGDSRHEHWREVMEIVQRTRRRSLGRRARATTSMAHLRRGPYFGGSPIARHSRTDPGVGC